MADIKVQTAHFLDNGATMVEADIPYIRRVLKQTFNLKTFNQLIGHVKYLGVSRNLKEMVDLFCENEDGTPAGFRIEWVLEDNGLLRADLIRDIGYEKNGIPRPTNMLFSADCCDPYEVDSFKHILSNITTNPVIIYDRFLTNPKANIGNKFKTREEVLSELHKIVGPGADISVELNNPFSSDEEILAEAESFTELIPKSCLVVKVPHFGPLTKENISLLSKGSFPKRYNNATTKSAFRCHDIALMLHEHGYRVNFTLMFEPYQIALALQARPYFINCFVRNRYWMSDEMDKQLKRYEVTGDEKHLEKLQKYMIEKDYLCSADATMSLNEVAQRARQLLAYRDWDGTGSDGLDQARDALRHLKRSHLPDSKLIVCSMGGDFMYPQLDKMLLEEEFSDMKHRVVISAAPDYFAQFTSAPDVLSYNRNFAKAAMKA